jgi:hypothetical protein
VATPSHAKVEEYSDRIREHTSMLVSIYETGAEPGGREEWYNIVLRIVGG